MALGRAHSVAVAGVDGQLVEIEADIGQGLPSVHLVGLPDTALSESRDRVRSAVANSGEKWPDGRVILALSPATLPKIGSVYDLALAVSVLDAAGAVPSERLAKTVLLGELALDGRVRRVRGILPAVITARNAGCSTVVVPECAMAEAGLVEDVEVFGAASLRAVVAWLRGEAALPEPSGELPDTTRSYGDLSEVVGQDEARWALEVAAAGGHHLLLTGPPGIGKTMLAQRLPGLLPPLSEAEALEVTAIHSVAGALSGDHPLITVPPFVAPHHSTSVTAMIGGGSGSARPGAVSRAHRGVLFLDECAEIGVKVLEAMRTPLEEGEVRIARRDGVARYPARFQLVLAANPCPCAPARDVDCICAPLARRRYLGKLSGPLMDRIDIWVQMHGQSGATFSSDAAESSAVVRERVAAARKAALHRWREHGWLTNAEVPGHALRQRFRLPRESVAPVEAALRMGRMSARGADRAIRVAWTICDLRGADVPSAQDVMLALNFRQRGAQ
ncbi:magnesium chelatase family protein [Nocardia amikacinitolerans]|uniref:Magnesium chelatase family protein n=1 Tax=Nocardia amikacinitolerans TaxID=756689 RepID=A0A285LUI4_9NOCA|nr:YifB family Mg chelatase-like AAA ATPase [Nocardia amikacinitolerans]MCP2280273.1 magnesium chelatase family protein [Nocardia amikacinitolerans]MCP2299549.1 magnesium chelatase family protein [Nocardia amikacinitolerans]SNY88580.1 magnesium chelatase family protein [Nocardia amikacinitolerans]